MRSTLAPGVFVSEHLPNAVSVQDFHVSQMSEKPQNAPFVRGRFMAQRFLRRAQHDGGNLFRALLGVVEVVFQFRFGHRTTPKRRPLPANPIPKDDLSLLSRRFQP